MLRKTGWLLGKAAWMAALCLTAGLAAVGMILTAQLRAPEVVRYVINIKYLPGLLALLAVLIFAARRMRVRWMSAALVIWTLLSAAFVVGADTKQIVDFAYVCDAAKAFALSDYSPLAGDYFHVYSYQLGTCLALEGVARLLPGADLNLVMQVINVLLSAATAYMLALLSGELFEREDIRCMTIGMYILFLPAALYNIHVYGTLPMLFCCVCALLCMVRCMKGAGGRSALGYVLFAALAYMLKPNAAVMLIAVVICSALHALVSRDIKPLVCALAGAAMAVVLARLAIAQYELRSGMTMRADVSMLARLVMGLQDGSRGAGWYNGYTEQFFPASISAAQEKEIALADLYARLCELAGDPIRALIFLVQKAVSQWLEPTYGTLLYGNAAHLVSGYDSGIEQAVFSESSMLRTVMEMYMKVWQQAFYVLCALGLGSASVRRGGPRQLLIPVMMLGGFLYHMLFEAKSQYIYMYAVCMIPLAAQGLEQLAAWIGIAKRRYKMA